MESRPKRRSIPSSSAAPAPPEDSTEGSQVGVMGNVVESLRRKQEEASTRRQLLILRSKLEKETRESEVPPSVAVSSEEEAPEEPTEEPPEKPTEEIAEEPTEKPTEELAEEPTEKPTKELAKEDGESDEGAWGRWRGPLEDASSSWHGTTAPMEPPEGPSVDALGRQKERDAAQWTGPTTALGRSSIWYDPEAEEETVVPEGGAKKKKKKKKESAPAKGAAVEEVPETPPPSEEQLQVQRIQELFQTFGPEETSGGRDGVVIAYGGCAGGAYGAGAGDYGSHRSARACSGDGGCRRRGKEEEKEKKKEEGIPGLCRGCCDGGRGPGRGCRWCWRHRPWWRRCWWCGNHRCGKRWSGGPEEAEEKERSSVVVPQVDSKADPVVVSQVGVPFGSKEAEEEEERSSQNSSCGGAFRRRGGAGAGDGAAGAGDGASGTGDGAAGAGDGAAGAGDGAAYPRSFSASCTFGGGAYDCGRSDGGRSDCGHSGCGPCGCGTYGCGGLSRVKAEAVSKSSGSCSCIRSFAAAAVAATASRACGSVCPTCKRERERSVSI